MGNDDQLNLDFAVEQTPWGKWVDADRRAAQSRKFMDHAGLRTIPAQPWPEDSPEVERLNPIVAELFPDLDTAMAPENADVADAFICFMGECFIKYAGAQWIEEEWFGPEYSFYDHVNPALLFDNHDQDVRTAWRFMDNMIGYHPGDHAGMFSYLTAALHEYRTYHEDKRREDASM